MQQIMSDTLVAAELWFVFSSQEDAEDLTDSPLHERAFDDGVDAPSLEELIQAVLNSNTEQMDAVDSLDSARL